MILYLGIASLLLNIATGGLDTLKFPVNIVRIKRMIGRTHQI